MRGLPKQTLAILLIAAAWSTANAWTPRTRAQMADQAVRLMPASLRIALENHREPLLRGMLEPMVREDEPEHRPPWAEGRLDEQVALAAADLRRGLSEGTGFDEIAGRFGALAHYVADASFPPLASSRDGQRRYAHFASFCEERAARFPVVFHGHDMPELSAGNWRAFTLELLQQADAEDRELGRAYAAAGDPPDASHFDDRSVPFAVGSLAYSNTITNIVRTWLRVWQQAGGDMGRTPYWKPVPEGAEPRSP